MRVPAPDVLLISDDRSLVGHWAPDSSPGATGGIRRVARLAEGLDAVAAVRPEVVLLDLSAPDGNGLAGVIVLCRLASAPPVIALTDGEDPDLAAAAVQAIPQSADFRDTLRIELAGSNWNALPCSICSYPSSASASSSTMSSPSLHASIWRLAASASGVAGT